MNRYWAPLFLITLTLSILITTLFFTSCTPTYEANTLENSIKRICKKGYDIDDVTIKIVGKTLGVYLPLDKLFSANLDSLASDDEETSFENLFKFNPAAMDIIEDVLFTTSRVILSTDRPIDFYVLKAGETKTTGIELVLTGYVEDMKRVRFWDIPISEYRKRLLHDLSINRTVIWKRTVTEFFNHIGNVSLSDLIDTHFTSVITLKDISPFFYSQLLESDYKDNLRYDFLIVKTKPISEDEVLVYTKIKESYEPKAGYEQYRFLFADEAIHEYLVVLKAEKTTYRVHQVIPFYFIDEERIVRDLDFPDELKIYDNIDKWNEEFDLQEIFMGDFIAQQLTKRVQAMIAVDPHLQKSYAVQNLGFIYDNGFRQEGEEPARDGKQYTFVYETMHPQVAASLDHQVNTEFDEEFVMLCDTLLNEFAQVTYSYKFNEYNHIEILESRALKGIKVSHETIQQIRMKKLTVEALLSQL